MHIPRCPWMPLGCPLDAPWMPLGCPGMPPEPADPRGRDPVGERELEHRDHGPAGGSK